jgi:hypothetical protein
LALSQVEGIFSEMLHAFNPKKKKSSLPAYVQALRPAHKHAESYFDYYEFSVPIQRNRFMHFGIDEDIKEKAYDLMYDLVHVLSTYQSLEAPLVKLSVFLERRDPDLFRLPEGFNAFFALVEECRKHPDYKKVEKGVADFESNFLSKGGFLEDLADHLETEVSHSIKELIDNIKTYTKLNTGTEVNLNLWTLHTLSITKDKERLGELLKDFWSENSDSFHRIVGIKYFLDRAVQQLPSMDVKTKDRFRAILRANETDLKKFKVITEDFETYFPK